jgi:hypothetical protein
MPSASALTEAANRLADTFSTGDNAWWTEAEYIAQQVQPTIGRPSALSDVPRVAKYLSKIAAGNYLETAARLAGFAKQTVYEWREHAENPDHPNRKAFLAFADAEKRAEAAGEDEQVQNVRKAAQKEQFWAAGMTLLERRFPDRWGRRESENSGPRVVVQIGIKDSEVQVQLHTGSPPSLSVPVGSALCIEAEAKPVSD